MTTHAKASPSAAHRWLNCPGCVALCQKVPRRPSSIYADEGTRAHALGELCLRTGENATIYTGKTLQMGRDIKPGKVSAEMAEAVQVYLDEIRRKRKALVGATFKVEEKLDASWVHPDLFGTGDHICIEPIGCLYVDDYKHGAGVAVDVGTSIQDGNEQLLIYGVGALGKGNPHMIEEIELTVIQPRAQHRAGPIRSLRLEVGDLLDWAETVLRPGINLALSGKGHLAAGSWCRWCDAEAICPEHKNAVTTAMFGNDTLPAVQQDLAVPPTVETLTPEQLFQIYPKVDLVRNWLNAIESACHAHVTQVGPAHGYKLVQGFGNRAWKDESVAVATLASVLPKEEIYTEPKMKTPAQIEKALTALKIKPDERKQMLYPLAEKPLGKKALVPITDQRPALPPAAEAMFG